MQIASLKMPEVVPRLLQSAGDVPLPRGLLEEFEEQSKNPARRFHYERRGNPNWGKPDSGPGVPIVTEFEKTANEYNLNPDQYLQSSQLREWARRNMKSKFVPESLLKAWGFEIEASDW